MPEAFRHIRIAERCCKIWTEVSHDSDNVLASFTGFFLRTHQSYMSALSTQKSTTYLHSAIETCMLLYPLIQV